MLKGFAVEGFKVLGKVDLELSPLTECPPEAEAAYLRVTEACPVEPTYWTCLGDARFARGDPACWTPPSTPCTSPSPWCPNSWPGARTMWPRWSASSGSSSSWGQTWPARRSPRAERSAGRSVRPAGSAGVATLLEEIPGRSALASLERPAAREEPCPPILMG